MAAPYDDRRDDRAPPARGAGLDDRGAREGGVKHFVSRDAHPRKVFLGGLDERTSKADVEEFLSKAGPLVSVWVARSPPGFAFVEFEDARDAADAARDLDGRSLRGKPVKVEISSGLGRTRRPGPPEGGRGGGRHDDRDGRPPPRTTECYFCHGSGHFARNCPQQRDGGRGRSRSPPRRYEERYDDRRGGNGYDDRRAPAPAAYDRYDDRRGAPPAAAAPRGRSRSPPRRRSPSPGGRRRSPSPRAARRSPSPRRDAPAAAAVAAPAAKDDVRPRSPSPKRD